MADEVKRTLLKLREEMPAGTEIAVVRDSSIFIRESVDDVQTTLLIGGFLTVLIVFCFLNSWRSTVITGLTLPISVISSFIAMYFFGMTMNTMTLMALSLAIGLLIDDAIVVRENIVRHLEHGEDHFEAAREGTSEIGLAVLATTLSIVAVFVPVAFMKGVIGRFFFQFGITVTFAVLVSLFVSFTLDPMLSSRWFDPAVGRKGRRLPLARLLERFNDAFDRTADRYRTAIGWALDHRKTVVGAAALAFVAGLALFGTLESEFMSTFDRGEFNVRFKTAPGASIEETKGRLSAILEGLRGFPEIEHTYGTIAAGDSDTVRDGLVFVKLKDRAERTRSQAKIVTDARSRLERIPGVQLSIEDDPDQMQRPLQLLIRGDEISKLKEYAGAVKREMSKIPGIVDLDASMEQDLPEYRLAVNRARAAEAGLRTEDLSRTLGVLVGGQAVSTYEDEEGEAVDVRVRLPRALRQDLSQVGDLRIAVPVPGGPSSLMPIGDLVTAERTASASEIDRRDLARQAVIGANLDGLPLGTAASEALKAAGRVEMVPGYRIAMAGDTEMMVESFGYLAEALLLAVVFVYLILAAQFESFMDPLAIMLALPLSIVGMAGMLVLTGDTVNIMSLIGLIMLMGLVTKNAILLVDFAKVLQKRGMSRREAVVTAGRTRLRPIMMTTLAMIFGMMPLALGIGAGAEWRAPMARAVVGGLITSTLLTLLVVPVVYTVLDDLGAWMKGKWRRKAATAAALVLATALAGRTDAAEAGRRALTLDETVAIALERNRDVRKARESRNWIEGRYVEELAAAFPQLTLGVGGERLHDESQRALFAAELGADIAQMFPSQQDVRSVDLKISQPLYTWGKVGSAIRAAKVGFEISDDQIRQARHTAQRDASAAFYDVLLAKDLDAVARKNLEQKTRHLDEARRKLALGTATDYDVLAAEVAVENARPDTIRTESAIRVARDRMRFVLAVEEEVDAAGTLDTAPASVPSHAAALALALEHRPDLHDLVHRVTAQKALLAIAKTGDKPRLDFRGAWGRKQYVLPDVSASGKVWNAGIFMTFPFFDGGRTRGQVRQSRSDLTVLEIEIEKMRDSVALEVRTALDSLREAGQIVEALAGTAGQAERLLSMAEKGFELGVKTRLDVEDAQFNLTMARGNLARARRDCLVARVNLDFVMGVVGDAPPSG